MKCSPLLLKGNICQSLKRQATSRFRARLEPISKSAILYRNIQRQDCSGCSIRRFSSDGRPSKEHRSEEKYKAEAKELNKKGLDVLDEGKSAKDGQIKYALGGAQEKQSRKPWHREGPEEPPVKKPRSSGAMTKGKLLTTPSRLLKLILPVATIYKDSNQQDIEPLALLVHPQQPLSYLERLIQSELPMIKNEKGEDKIPEVWFRAEDSAQENENGQKPNPDEIDVDDIEAEVEEDMGEQSEKSGTTGKIDKNELEDSLQDADIAKSLRGGPGEGGIETYSGMGHEISRPEEDRKFVRWSTSTEIGDFIRDAARGKEFAVVIEGAPKEIRVGVPSFGDRTHYLRVRLRKTSKQLEGMTRIKRECDYLAHRSAQRLAVCGFGLLVAWWGSIYHFTFRTDYGWDTMEPITYLAGLSSIILGYLYFLWHNREVSYRSALHITVSHRQNQLYTSRGFDFAAWESLVGEANAMRKEIKKVAEEYDVDWDELKDEVSEIVHDALKKERHKKERAREDDEDEDEDEDFREERRNKKN